MSIKTPTLDQLKETVALSHRILYAAGLATDRGHSSARVPGTDTFLIKSWPHIQMCRIQGEDIITMDFEGNIVGGKPEGVTRVSEWPLHAELYRAHPDLGAVIHTHQKWASMMGIAQQTVLPVFGASQSDSVADGIPMYDDDRALIRQKWQGELMVKVMSDAPAVHLQSHGMAFAGPNLESVTIDAVNIEYQAELTWHALAIGGAHAIPRYFTHPHVERRKLAETPEAWEHFWKWVDENPESYHVRGVHL